MTNAYLDTLDFSRFLYERTVPSLSFCARSREEAEVWQQGLRERLAALMGRFPEEKPPVMAEVVETREFPTYTRETIFLESRPRMTVYGYLLLPKNPKEPFPAVLCLHGHGRGVDDIVGIEEDGSMRTGYGGYQRDFALQCVNRGYAAFAVEQLGFGHRRDQAARSKGNGNSSCQPSAGAALLFGQTMIGWRVWDAIRSLDYLSTRPEIDPARLAVMGISGGGTTSFFTAAMDERVKAAVISGYFNTFRDSIMSVSHCMDNYIPGILMYAEMYDIAGLIAPRALFAESGSEDHIFPEHATRYAIEQARRIYSIWDASDKIDCDVFKGGHQFHGAAAFEFLSRTL